MRRILDHLPEYAIEAALLATFMVSACSFGVLLEHPDSPIHRAIGDPLLRRVLMGVAMGTTAIAIIYSPWGGRSGAHLTSALLGPRLAHASVHYVVTRPGRWGVGPALAAEVLISAVLMSIVVALTGSRWARFTGLVVGVLVATYISVEAPVSGMSMNPARSFGSAWGAGDWRMFWVYVAGPLLGMNLGALLATAARARPACAKLHHPESQRCIFCGHVPAADREPVQSNGIAFRR